MRNLAIVLLLSAAVAHAEEQPVCVSQTQATVLVKGVIEMSATINQQRVEIEALKRLLAEHGIEYVPAWQRFLQQIEEVQRGR